MSWHPLILTETVWKGETSSSGLPVRHVAWGHLQGAYGQLHLEGGLRVQDG